jgi:ABC-type multidrug transport system ATPase subunit
MLCFVRPWRGTVLSVIILHLSCKSWLSLAVTGVAYPGELLAIMGASGAGKTTLLNTLMFRSPPSLHVSGQRALNGVPVCSGTLASLSAYVQQHDLFIGTLTVREHLIFQVLRRLFQLLEQAIEWCHSQ